MGNQQNWCNAIRVEYSARLALVVALVKPITVMATPSLPRWPKGWKPSGAAVDADRAETLCGAGIASLSATQTPS